METWLVQHKEQHTCEACKGTGNIEELICPFGCENDWITTADSIQIPCWHTEDDTKYVTQIAAEQFVKCSGGPPAKPDYNFEDMEDTVTRWKLLELE